MDFSRIPLKSSPSPELYVQSTLQYAWQKSETDFKVFCDLDKSPIPCHEMILSLASPFLRRIFQDLQDAETCLILPDFSYSSVCHLVLNCYCVDSEDPDPKNEEEIKSLLQTLEIEVDQDCHAAPLCEVKLEIEEGNEEIPEAMEVSDELSDEFDESQDENILTFECAKCGVDVETTRENHEEIVKKISNEKILPRGKRVQVEYHCKKCTNPQTLPAATVKVQTSGKQKAVPSETVVNKEPSKDTPENLASKNDTSTGKQVSQDVLDKVNQMQELYGWKKHIDYKRKRIDHLDPLEKVKQPSLCPECGKVLAKSVNLEYHMNLHLGLTPFKCNECPKEYTAPKYLNAHVRKCHPKLKIKCKKCSEMTKDLVMHDASYHDPRLPLSCDKCEFRTANNNVLINHKSRIHRDPNDGENMKLQCEKCPAMIVKSNMTSHMKNCHDERLPIACKYCYHRSLDESSMMYHVGMFHYEQDKNVKKLTCPNNCGSSFTAVSSVNAHVKKHCKFSTTKDELKLQARQREDFDMMRQIRLQKSANRKRRLKEILE